MSSWRIVRGVKTNRVRAHNKPRGGITDPSPTRAKLRQRSDRAGEVWTVISVCLRVDDLIAIDEIAERLGLSRSMFLVEKARGKR